MIYRHTQEQINEYFDNTGINQSGLKILIKDGVQAFIAQKEALQRQADLYYDDPKHFTIGSSVDMQITQTKEEFNAKYFISNLVKKPGDKARAVLKRAFAGIKESFPQGPTADISDYRAAIYNACNAEAYYMNNLKPTWEEDNRYNRIIKDSGNSYWIELDIAGDRQILDDSDVGIIDAIVNSILTHKHTRGLLIDSPTVDIVYQFPVYFMVNGIACKGMLDITRIDHDSKTVYPIDNKTMRNYVLEFYQALNDRRYDLQGAFYNEGLRQCLEQLSKLVGKDVTGYRIANPAFMVESTTSPGTPLVFILKNGLLNRGKVGSVTPSGYTYQGYEPALEIYKKWADVDFSLEERFKETNGKIFIDEGFDPNINL